MTKMSEVSNRRSKRVLSPILRSLPCSARTGLGRQRLCVCLLARGQMNQRTNKAWPCRPSHRQSRSSSRGTVRMLLLEQIKAALMHPQSQGDVVKPMNIKNIPDQEVKTLSGGEPQRVAIVLAMGKPKVNVYLIDEPSSSSCVVIGASLVGLRPN